MWLCVQIGSYFGASLCSVDMNRDGSTDLVLIGAPHYYEPTQGGQVSVCPLPKGVSADGTWVGGHLPRGAGLPGWGMALFLFFSKTGGGAMLFSKVSRAIPGAALGQP